MADTNRVALSYAKETTYGTAPTGTYQRMRLTGESLEPQNGALMSDELRSDRQVADIVRSSLAAGGGINGEVSYGTWDEMLRAAVMAAAWSSEVTVIAASTAITFSSGGATATLGLGSWTNTPTVGELILVEGGAAAGVYVVTSASSTVIGLSPAPAADTGSTVTIKQLASIANGTTLDTFTFEREYTDLASGGAEVVEYFPGSALAGFTLSADRERMLQIALEVMSKRALSDIDLLGSSYTAVNTNGVLNTVEHLAVTRLAGVARPLTALSMRLANNLRGRTEIGTLGYGSIGTGTVEVTGNLGFYFNDAAVWSAIENFTEVDYLLGVNDAGAANMASGNTLLVYMPAIKLSKGRRVAGGKNQDVIGEVEFMAKRSAAYGYTFKIARAAR